MLQEQRAVSAARLRRSRRVRQAVRGTAERPRLSIHRSLKHLSIQIIDDLAGRTLVAVSDRNVKGATPRERAEAVGKLAADKAKAKGIAAVVFDRGSYLYHGRVKAAADGARAGGLLF